MRYFQIVDDKFRKNDREIKLPTRATSKSIAYDFYSPVDMVIPPHSLSPMIWSDVKAYFNENEALLLNVRSSQGKQPVMLANTQGWIESDYADNIDNDGNIGFRFYNLGDTDYVIKTGDRIAQGMFTNYLITDNDASNGIRVGGFGSSGK